MTRHITREDAVALVQRRVIARANPRAVVLFILGLSGGTAFLFSAGTLKLGIEHMGARYFLASLAGYATFLMLIRAWIAYRRRSNAHDDVVSEIASSVPDIDVSPSRASIDVVRFAGGRSGGAGSGAQWGQSSVGAADALNIDADEFWPIVLALACAIGAVFALVYVVYAAPLLLAEVALDAALVGAVYRRLRRRDARHWLGSGFRRTWLPALATSLLLMLAGFALQWAVPDAQSLGDVLREFQSRS